MKQIGNDKLGKYDRADFYWRHMQGKLFLKYRDKTIVVYTSPIERVMLSLKIGWG